MCTYPYIGEAYSCEDNHDLVTSKNQLLVSCPTASSIISRTTPVSGPLPTLSPAVAINKLPDSIYKLANYTTGEMCTYIHIIYIRMYMPVFSRAEVF